MIAFMPTRYRIICKIAVVVMCLVVLSSHGGCATFDNAAAAETIDTLEQRIATMDAAASDPTKTPEQREIAALKAKQYRDDLQRMKELAEEDAKDDQPDPVEGTVTAIGNAVAGAVPGAGVIIAAGIPIYFRARKAIREHKRAEEQARIIADTYETAMTQTVEAVENAKEKVPAFNAAWQEAKLAVEAKMDESTKEIVEKVKTASKS